MKKLTYATEGVKPVLGEAEIQKIVNIYEEMFASYLDSEGFKLEVGATAETVQVKMTLAKKSGRVAYPVECVMPVDAEDADKLGELALLAVEFVASYWSEYFSNSREVYLPLDWQEHEYSEKKLYIRGFIRNISLEEEADALLKKHGSGALI